LLERPSTQVFEWCWLQSNSLVRVQ
jgi:hypothetical protein